MTSTENLLTVLLTIVARICMLSTTSEASIQTSGANFKLTKTTPMLTRSQISLDLSTYEASSIINGNGCTINYINSTSPSKHCSSGCITLSSTLTSIGFEAFYKCTNLNGTLTIPNTVTNIWQNAFYETSISSYLGRPLAVY